VNTSADKTQNQRPMVGSSFPNYCPYHRYVHRPLEDCWVFQNWMQREYEAGRLALGEDALLNPPTQTKMVKTLHDRRPKGKVKSNSVGWLT